MKQQILDEIKKNNKMTYKALLSKFNIGHRELEQILLTLKLEGKILQLHNHYKIFPNGLYLGNVLASSSNRKYIMCNNQKISLASNFLNGLMLNDVVTFTLNDNNEAEIYTIVDRQIGKMTCEVRQVNGKKTIIPYHDNINVKLPNHILDKLYDGDIIVVNIDPFTDETYLETIGRKDDPLIDDLIIALNYGFDDTYDEEYMAEVAALPTFVSEKECQNRIDYRNQPCFTIDGKYTKDMDDGVYGEICDNDIVRIYVHIADVSHYIKENSRIFERACQKTTSLYLNNSVFHMLHHIISYGICSLNENCDRLTKTIVMDIDSKGNIVNFDIQKSVINSKKKMTYEDVDEIIMHNNMVSGYEPFEKTLYILYKAALRLEQRYVDENGKNDFANNELSIDYNDDGTIQKVNNHSDSISRKIIEYLMIAANETVANWFLNIDMPTVYRVHEIPSASKINRVIAILNKEGYKIKPVKDIDNPKVLQKVLHVISAYEEYPIISSMLVMAMPRAKYSVENVGHYALALLAYLHFTSPIRRLADLLVHQIIDLIYEEPDKITPEYLNELEKQLKYLCNRASQMERQADMAERVAERRQLLKSLKINEEYTASIIDIGKKITIRLAGIDTFVDSQKLNSVLSYDSKRKRYYDRYSGNHLKIGSKLLAKITSIDRSNGSFNVKVLGMVNEYTKKKKMS